MDSTKPENPIDTRRPKPLVFAHRGGAACWPENTLLAFENSARAGSDFIETDARVTADHQLVLFHDPTLERTTDGRGSVAEFTLCQLKELDAAYRFRSHKSDEFSLRGTGIRICTPDELAETCPHTRFSVELKAGSSCPSLVLNWIKRHSLWDRVIVAGAKHRLLTAFRQQAGPRVQTSASTRDALELYCRFIARRGKPANLSYSTLQIPEHFGPIPLATERFIAHGHALGLAVHFWTVNERERMEKLLRLGADGIMTDDPELLLSVRAELEASGKPLPAT